MPTVEVWIFKECEISLTVFPDNNNETISNSLGDSELNGLPGFPEKVSSASLLASDWLMYFLLSRLILMAEIIFYSGASLETKPIAPALMNLLA